MFARRLEPRRQTQRRLGSCAIGTIFHCDVRRLRRSRHVGDRRQRPELCVAVHVALRHHTLAVHDVARTCVRHRRLFCRLSHCSRWRCGRRSGARCPTARRCVIAAHRCGHRDRGDRVLLVVARFAAADALCTGDSRHYRYVHGHRCHRGTPVCRSCRVCTEHLRDNGLVRVGMDVCNSSTRSRLGDAPTVAAIHVRGGRHARQLLPRLARNATSTRWLRGRAA